MTLQSLKWSIKESAGRFKDVESGKRKDERSQQHLAPDKLGSDLAELEGERKVDVVAMGDARPGL